MDVFSISVAAEIGGALRHSCEDSSQKSVALRVAAAETTQFVNESALPGTPELRR